MGVSALVNEAVTGGKSIQLYYNDKNSNLGLSLKAGDGSSDPDKTFVASSTDPTGQIVNPSHLGSGTKFHGINLVVGFTLPKLKEGQKDYESYDVSVLSPIYQPLTTTTPNNTTISVCSSPTVAYVYYLTGTDDTDTRLHEYRLDSLKPSSKGRLNSILKGSSLAAYWHPDKKKPYVVYQTSESGNNLYEYNIQDDQSTHLKNSSNALKGTTLAVTYANKKAYLYYTDDAYNIQRIIKCDDKWGSSEVLDDADRVGQTSQLAVVTSNNINHLFYEATGGADNSFTHYSDPISS